MTNNLNNVGLLLVLAVVIASNLQTVNMIGISSKLDFDEDSSSVAVKPNSGNSEIKTGSVSTLVNVKTSPGIVSSRNHQTGLYGIGKINLLNNQKQNYNDGDNLGVVCVNNKCASTGNSKTTGASSVASSSDDMLLTDVRVQVITNVQKSNKNKSVDSNDIPIIQSFGSSLSNNRNTYNTNNRNTNTYQYVPIISTQDNNNVKSSYPSTSSSFVPIIRGTSDNTANNNIPIIQPIQDVPVIPGFDPKIPTSIGQKYRPTMSTNPTYISVQERRSGSYPSDSIWVHGARSQSKLPAIELKIPYFEPSFNNHYFGEEAPPSVLDLDTQNTYNPKAFPTPGGSRSYWSTGSAPNYNVPTYSKTRPYGREIGSSRVGFVNQGYAPINSGFTPCNCDKTSGVHYHQNAGINYFSNPNYQALIATPKIVIDDKVEKLE